MASRVLKALTSRMCHKNMPADPPMKRGQHLSSMTWKSFSKKEIGHTGSARPLQGLLLRLPRLAERVANAVTFLTHICASNTSKRLGNGRGVPLSGTYVPWIGTHRSNRWSASRACREGGGPGWPVPDSRVIRGVNCGRAHGRVNHA